MCRLRDRARPHGLAAENEETDAPYLPFGALALGLIVEPIAAAT